MRDPQITVNGQSRPLAGVPAHTNALDFLRGLGLTGAKEGCAEGECGACAVMVCRPAGDGSRWTSVNSCLVPATALDGQEVVTAEGLGSPEHLHPVQAEMAARGGSQCGYCTPGFVCSMAAEYYRTDGRRLRRGGHERQPVPLHGLPPDPRRRPGARRPGRGRRPRRAAARPAPGPAATRLDGAVRRRPRRRARTPAGPPRRHGRRRRPPTGASRSTCGGGVRRTSCTSTACPSSARCRPRTRSRSAPASP